MIKQGVTSAGFIRRFGALIYDWLSIIAIWFLQTALLLPFTQGEALPEQGLAHWAYLALLYSTALGFFLFFWHRNGQTLGMRAWRLRLVRHDGEAVPAWGDLVRRYLAAGASLAAFGLGFFWSLIDAERRTWHDLASGTVLVRLPKSKKIKPAA